MRDHWVMDYETLVDCFIGVFESHQSEDRREFVCYKYRNDYAKLKDFLRENVENYEFHFSFNGLSFDAQVTQFIIESDFYDLTGDEIGKEVYKFVQNNIIPQQSNRPFPKFPYREWEIAVKQVDLFKLNHWDNPAKSSSLKWIQYSMDWHNIQEMPIHHTTSIQTEEQLNTVLAYCVNDVKSTKKIFLLSKSQIRLRNTLTQEYNINLYSASEPRISKEIFAYFLSNSLGIPKKELRTYKTKRTEIVVDDIILPYISFSTPDLQNILSEFRKIVINPLETKGSLKLSMNYKGVKTDFGLGGVHGANSPGVYKSDEDHVIMSSDVTSFYPNLAIRNQWSPEHLDNSKFCELYEWFFEERKKIPKSDPRNYVYKIILNSTYGLSNDENSFLYDPEFTMRITINGQLSLMMLYEMICLEIPECVPLMQNTDGLETKIPRSQVDKYLEICRQWEKITNLQLEHDTYEKVILADVNNYIALTEWKELKKDTWMSLKVSDPDYLYKISDGKFYIAMTKCKGRFEFKGLALHKNKSSLIIPKAIYNYFIKGTPPEVFLQKNRNIMDYCIGNRARGAWVFASTCVIDGQVVEEELQHVIRYYISNKGCKIIKKNKTDNREIQTEAGRWVQTVYNVHSDKQWQDYDVNESYYLQSIEKEINNISQSVSQLNLFA